MTEPALIPCAAPGCSRRARVPVAMVPVLRGTPGWRCREHRSAKAGGSTSGEQPLTRAERYLAAVRAKRGGRP